MLAQFLALSEQEGLRPSRRRCLHRNRRNILIAHELIKRRHIGLHDLRQLRQLRIDLRNQIIVNRIRLSVGAASALDTTPASAASLLFNRIG